MRPAKRCEDDRYQDTFSLFFYMHIYIYVCFLSIHQRQRRHTNQYSQRCFRPILSLSVWITGTPRALQDNQLFCMDTVGTMAHPKLK